MCKALRAAWLSRSITILGSAGWNLKSLYQNSPCWSWKANMQCLAVFKANFYSEPWWSSGECSSSLPPCWEPCMQVDSERYVCWGDGNGEPMLCLWVELLKNLTMWFEDRCFRRAHLSRHLLLNSPFLRSLNWMIFYHKLLCSAMESFLMGKPPPQNLVTLWYPSAMLQFCIFRGALLPATLWWDTGTAGGWLSSPWPLCPCAGGHRYLWSIRTTQQCIQSASRCFSWCVGFAHCGSGKHRVCPLLLISWGPQFW